MKKIILIFVLLSGLTVFGFAQKRTKIQRPKISVPPPPISPRVIPAMPINQNKSAIEKLLDTSTHPPLAFEWRLNADTTLLPKRVFCKHLEIDLLGATRIENRISSDTLHIKIDHYSQPLSFYVNYEFYKTKLTGHTLVLKNKDTGNILTFELFLNKENNQIIKVQDVLTKEVYLPATFEGGAINM